MTINKEELHVRIEELIDAEAALTHGTEPLCPVVLSSRIRLARNLNEFPFPGWAQRPERYKVLSLCEQAISQLMEMKSSAIFEMDNLDDVQRQILVERRMISRELSASREASAVVMSKDQTYAIMINEEDHIRLQVVCNGFNFPKVWKMADAMDSQLENFLDYAFSGDIGYLTACPTNVGTGMRASVMMHLPALVMSNQMEKVMRGMNQLGIAVRGIAGEGSDASGSFFQISNQQTLGESEQEILNRMSRIFQSVIEHELNAREKLLEEERSRILDKICRAFAILKNACLMTSSEAMNLLSLMRLGIDFGMLPDAERGGIDRLFIQCQPAHVQFKCLQNKTACDGSKRDEIRANFMRDYFRKLPDLNLPF